MNRLYVNGLIWHFTNAETITEAVAECIEQGIWNADHSAECELCNEIDQTIEYNRNYSMHKMYTAQKYVIYHNPNNMNYEEMEYIINEKLSPIGGHFENNTFIFREDVIAVSAMCLVENIILLPIDPKYNSQCVSASYENDFIDKCQNLSWEDLAQEIIEYN